MLIVDCIKKNEDQLAGCLTGVGQGAMPGGSWSDQPAATCSDYDRKGAIECLTGTTDSCCYVLGIDGCSLTINNEVITIF
jgi:hypothetical protein